MSKRILSVLACAVIAAHGNPFAPGVRTRGVIQEGDIPKMVNPALMEASGVTITNVATKAELASKADKVPTATEDNLTAFDDAGNIKDSEVTLTSVTNAISQAGSAIQTEVDPRLPAHGTEGNLLQSGAEGWESWTPDYANKVTGATEDNLVAFDDEGNIKETGRAAPDQDLRKADSVEFAGVTTETIAIPENGATTNYVSKVYTGGQLVITEVYNGTTNTYYDLTD